MLGILEAGRCFVALDPSRPPARHKEQLAYTDANALLAMPGDVAAIRAEGWNGEAISPPDGFPQAELVAIEAEPDSRACIYFTSGSTGEPKGVLWTVRTLRRAGEHIAAMFALHEADRHALLTPLVVASTPAQVIATLNTGGALHLFEARSHGMTALARWLGESNISTLQTTPSFFRAMAREAAGGKRWSALRAVKLGGEAASAADARLFETFAAPGAVLVNGLGITEAGFNICWFEWKPGDPLETGLLPIGQPPQGIEILVESQPGVPAMEGVTGEIVVRSTALAQGHWKDAELTARTYCDVSGRPGWRELRTGDAGMLRGDGQLLHRGRLDNCVKIRGHGVDPAHVETAIAAIPIVAEAAVIPAESRGSIRLHAFVKFLPAEDCDTGRLKKMIIELLPNHMVPARIFAVETLPRLENGKIDRMALAAQAVPNLRVGVLERLATETEELVSTAWVEELHLDAVGGDDDFFDLGGDSLAAAIISAKLHALLGVELQLDAFAQNPTVRRMAGFIDRLRAADGGLTLPPLVRISRKKPLPISLSQRHIWDASRRPKGSAAYTMASVHRITGLLDVAAFRNSVEYIVGRHEILRSTFAKKRGRPVLIIRSPSSVTLPLTDLSSSSDPKREAGLLVNKEARGSFDLKRGPLLRLRLIKFGEKEYWLQIVNHHLISDAWSWKIFFAELGLLYEARRRGEPAPLPEKKEMDYADFASWQRLHLEPRGEKYKKLLTWWKQILLDAPPAVVFPFLRDRPKPAACPSEGQVILEVDPDLNTALNKLGAKEGVTFYMMRLAGFAAQISLETQQQDLLVGGYTHTRELLEFQQMFGFFANQTPVRLKFSGNFTFRQWLARVRSTVLETLAHAAIPFDQLCDELTKEGVTLPEINSIVQASESMPSIRLGETDIANPERILPRMPWGFSLLFYRDCHRCEARFDATNYDQAGVRSMMERYTQFMAAACAEPDRPLCELMNSTSRRLGTTTPTKDLADSWDAAKLWDGLAPWWDEQIADQGSDLFRDVALKTMNQLVDIQPGCRVLDIACGNGWFSRKMARTGARVTAIDISPGMLERARCRSIGLGIDYIPLDVTSSGSLAELGHDIYDLAVCNMALQDLAALEPMFNGVRLTLKPGARFVVSFVHPAGTARAAVPRYSPLPQVALPGQPRPHIEVVRPIANILKTVRDAGWQVDELVELPSPSRPAIAILALTHK